MSDSEFSPLVLVLYVMFAESRLFPILTVLLVGLVNAVANGLRLSIVSVPTTGFCKSLNIFHLIDSNCSETIHIYNIYTYKILLFIDFIMLCETLSQINS